MKIAVAGGTGFVGGALVRRLAARGDDVVVLTRGPAGVKAGRPVRWDGRTAGPWSDEVASADAVVNLAGANIGEGRWTDARKRALISSRIDATRALVSALRTHPVQPRVLVNASAVGFYGVRGDEEIDERTAGGDGFLAELSREWEAGAREAESVARVVILRFGVILGPDGGALQKMLLPFRLGAGGPIGDGRQWMSWIALDDAVRMIEWAIDREEVGGTYNATAPAPVRNRDFARALGRALHRPAVLPAPGFALRLAFGEMADEVLLGGQKVLPRRAEAEGFTFQWREVDDALKRAIKPRQASAVAL